MPLVIGVTGSIATGKTGLCEHLVERWGAIHGDADKIVHRLFDPGKTGFDNAVKEFGREIVGDDGYIDRKKVGAIVFGNSEAMGRWTRAIGNIEEAMRTTISGWRETLDDNQIAILEAVNLIEAGYSAWCDVTWLVAAESPPRTTSSTTTARWTSSWPRSTRRSSARSSCTAPTRCRRPAGSRGVSRTRGLSGPRRVPSRPLRAPPILQLRTRGWHVDRAEVAQLVERLLAKEKVASSSLVFRSNSPRPVISLRAKLRRSGGTGRRDGLKNRWGETPVPVRPRASAPDLNLASPLPACER